MLRRSNVFQLPPSRTPGLDALRDMLGRLLVRAVDDLFGLQPIVADNAFAVTPDDESSDAFGRDGMQTTAIAVRTEIALELLLHGCPSRLRGREEECGSAA